MSGDRCLNGMLGCGLTEPHHHDVGSSAIPGEYIAPAVLHESNVQFRREVYARHGHCTVEQIVDLFWLQLHPTDVLVTNDVGNLAVLRGGEYIGFIELSNRDLGAEPQATWERKYVEKVEV